MSFPSYSRYRPSGVDWVGDVPNQWSICALSYRYEVALGKMLDEKRILGDHLAPYLRNIDVQWDRINTANLPEMDFSGDDLHRYSLRSGDLLVCEGGEVGRAAIWQAELRECFYQKALHRLRARESEHDLPRFMFYLLSAAVGSNAFSSDGGKATIAHLPAETFRRHRFPFPPIDEQTAIASFLDRETAKIDGLVEEQRRLIALLKEKRQAVISHAVTKGLDPSAPLKSSGIDWLGDIPAHWEVKRISNLYREVDERGEEGLPVLSVSIHHGVSDEEIGEFDGDRKLVRSEDRTKYKRVGPNDLVYNMMRAWQGGFGTVSVEGMVSPAYVVAKPRGTVQSAYVEAILRTPTAVEEMRRHSAGVTDFRLRLYWDEFKTIRIPSPPPDEVTMIMEHVSTSSSRFDDSISVAESAIELLGERRAALISAAVTGKIDVRGLVDPKRQAEAA